MKYLSYLFLAALSLISCADNEDELFELVYEVDIIYEAGLSQFEAHFIDTYDIQTRISGLLAASGMTRDEVTRVLPKSAELINTRSDVSLDFIQNITLRVFEGALFIPDEKQNELEIFFRDPVPQDRATLINLIPSLPDVKEHLLEDTFNFTTRSELRAPPPNTIEARLRLRFSVQ